MVDQSETGAQAAGEWVWQELSHHVFILQGQNQNHLWFGFVFMPTETREDFRLSKPLLPRPFPAYPACWFATSNI